MAITVLCDIKDAVPLTTMPPFLLTGLIVALMVILFFISKLRITHIKTDRLSKVENLSSHSTLEKLKCQYQNGELSAELLFTRFIDLFFTEQIDFRGKTSQEILHIAAKKQLSSEFINLASQFFCLSDRVKFSNYHPLDEEINWAFEAVSALQKFSNDTVQ